MLKVALTGGIATGKSYVLARFRDHGIPTIDADDVVHEAFGPRTPTTNAIATRFGGAFLSEDGSVDRRTLAAHVFNDPGARLQLEAIVHPMVYESIWTWFDALHHPLGLASIPLLYETGREHDFHAVVVTVCSDEMQLRRLMERDRLSEAEARQRIATQMPAEEKAARGRFVIRTDGTMPATDRQVEQIANALHRLTSGAQGL